MLIKNARIIDKSLDLDRTADMRFDGDILTEIGELQPRENETVIDASGLCAAAGFVDLHCHLREPGFEHKETIASGCASASAGGFTTVLCMPNLRPVPDCADAVRDIYRRAEGMPAEVRVVAAATVGCRSEEPSPYSELAAAGAVAVSDDGLPVKGYDMMEAAAVGAADTGIYVASHCEEPSLVKGGGINEGRISEMLGLPASPAEAEEKMIERDISISEKTGAHIHICHVSTAVAAELVRSAKARGVNVTAETCPHYISMTEDMLLTHGAFAKVNPPLRTPKDVEAIINAVIDGTIDAIATDHAPHSAEEKARGLSGAPSGFSGFETAFALCNTMLVKTGKLGLADLLYKMSAAPADTAGLPRGRIVPGKRTDIVLFDPDEEWIVDPEKFVSKGKNNPCGGMKLFGNVKYTLCAGRLYKGGKEVCKCL